MTRHTTINNIVDSVQTAAFNHIDYAINPRSTPVRFLTNWVPVVHMLQNMGYDDMMISDYISNHPECYYNDHQSAKPLVCSR